MHRFKSPYMILAEPHSSVLSVQDLRTGVLVRSMARPMFFARIGGSHCKRSRSSLTAFHCFNNVHFGKQPVAWREYCVEKELQESMDRCTGSCDITEILLKMVLNIESINLVCISGMHFL